MGRTRQSFRDNICNGSVLLIGYARVSTDDQDLTLQRAALKEAGCRRLYKAKLFRTWRNRPKQARQLD